MPTLKICGSTDLPIGPDRAWDGAAAASRVWEWAGFGGDSPDVAKAKRVHLIYDSDAPELKGSYHLLIADIIDGTPKVIPNGVRNAKSRAPQVGGASDELIAAAQAKCDKYLERINQESADGPGLLMVGEAPGGYQTLTASPTINGQPSAYAAKPNLLADGQPGLEGYLVPFHVLSDRGTYFVPGAFKRTIDENLSNAHHLYQHWPDLTLGKHVGGGEDRTGFRVAAQINEDKALGRDVMSDYRFGVPFGWSIGFDRVSSRSGTEADDKKLDRSGVPFLKNTPVNELEAITEARMWESSTVTWGAIHSARPDVVLTRSLPIDDHYDVSALLAALRVGRLSPDHRRQIEALLTTQPLRAAAGDSSHGTRGDADEFARPYAAEFELLCLELGIADGVAA